METRKELILPGREPVMDELIPMSTSNGHQSPTHTSQKGIPQKNRKSGFHRSFKQAVFLKRGNEDGSSQLHVSFTSTSAAAPETVKMSNMVPKPKTKPAPLYRDIVTIDKRKMQEEIDSLPKPEHLIQAEKELLDVKGIKIFKPNQGELGKFPCQGCLDHFPSQYTLNDHLERQSYSLSLDCPECHEKLIFTNKCIMYTHLASHYKANMPHCQYVAESSTMINILPRNQLKTTSTVVRPEPKTNGIQSENVEVIDVSKEENQETKKALDQDQPVVNEPTPLENAENGHVNENAVNGNAVEEEKISRDESEVPSALDGPNQSSNEEEQVVSENESEDVEEDKTVTCTECSKQFETEWTLRTHFTLPASDSSAPEICLSCRVELPTPCSYKAHMRLHSLSEPYTCPDCGIKITKKNIFLKHVRLQCLHYSKLSEYTCPGCPESFCHADEQLKHLQAQSQHLRFDGERSYYKCNGCPKAFKSVAAHSKHETCPGAGCTVVHMCNNCPQQTVFRSWTELIEHRSQAHPDLKWIPKRARIFSCYLCSHKTRSKQGFYDHLLKTHGKKKIDHMCIRCGAELESLQTLEIHNGSCPSRNEAKRASSLQPVTERLPKLSTSSSTTSDASMNNSSQPEPAESEQTTSTQYNDVTYLTYSPSFNCHICTAHCSNYSQLRDHVRKRHAGRGMIYECWLCRDRGNTANFYRQSTLDKHMNDVHKLQIPTSDDSTDAIAVNGDENESDPPAKKMKIWNDPDQPYQCCRCEYTAISGDDFKQHIKEHKNGIDPFQCVECGMCFPVQLALRRHLFAVHKVVDYVKYSRHLYMTEYEKQLHNTQGKCPVCSKEFEDDVQLRKHIRTHGMVYINTRRLPVN